MRHLQLPKAFLLLAITLLALLAVYRLTANDKISKRMESETSGVVGYDLPFDDTISATKVEEESFMQRMKDRQDERKALIRKTCQRFDIQHNITHMMPMMLVDEKYKVVHCSMGKTGTTRWKELFWQLKGLPLKEFKIQKYQRTKIFEDEKKILLNPDWIQTITVREPFERILSAYRQKLGPPGPEFRNMSKNIHAKYGSVKDGKLATFSDFINYLVLGAPESLQTGNEHWTRFTYPCTPCAIDYDFIGHQETIEEDGRYFLRMIGAPEHIKHGRANPNHTNDTMSLKYYSTVEPRERLIQLYSLLLQDYLMFGYPPPVALKSLFGKSNQSWQ